MAFFDFDPCDKPPFIFISYCHADEIAVKPYAKYLVKAKYRVWYDEKTTRGDDLSKQIEEKIEHSSLVIAFVSPNAIEKQKSYVQWEMTKADEHEKPLLPIYLAETKLPAELGVRHQNDSDFNAYAEEYKDNPQSLSDAFLDQVGKHLQPTNFPQQSPQQDTVLEQNTLIDVPNNWQATIATRLVQIGDKEPAPDWLAQLPIPEESDLPETTRHLIADLLIDRLERFPDDMENTQAWFKSLLCLPDAAAQPA